MEHFYEIGVWVATLTAMLAGSVDFLDPRNTHGSHDALAVATPGIFTRRDRLRNVIGTLVKLPPEAVKKCAGSGDPAYKVVARPLECV